MKVLWFSRHEMLPEQVADLTQLLGQEVVVEQVNMMFPAQGEEAAHAILNRVAGEQPVAIAGVFPAHVAVAMVYLAEQYHPDQVVLAPVSVPAPAQEGEVRGGGFVHSHWEVLM